MRRRGRVLSREERELWAAVARAVKPLPGRTAPAADEPAPTARPESAPAHVSGGPTRRLQPARLALPPLAPLERRTRRALGRGSAAIEGVLDLHGLGQADAHEALRGFLVRSQASGRSIVLIVTGKGGAGARAFLEERGVLRRVVPHWLALPDLRPLVLGFEPAAPHHGGEGALYVRLRRRRVG